MAIDQSRSKRTATGGRYISLRKKRKSDIGSIPTHTKVGELKKRADRVLGGNFKTRLLDIGVANVMNPKTKKCYKTKIKSVVKNPANRHYVRRNIITKGTIIDTEKGQAKVTSRPGQEATVNAVLIG
ncbi:30S ribosomal protein S8e [Candidatus Woesearchaeota archaeon]|nr:30S ribosomal protein S8e [Candidatus Woesearchaeota archaeon]